MVEFGVRISKTSSFSLWTFSLLKPPPRLPPMWQLDPESAVRQV